MPKPQSWKIALAWLAVIVWAGMVWGFGADALSQSGTSRYLEPLIEWLLPGLSPSEKWRLVRFARKSAHVFEYAVLAALLLRAFILSWRHSVALAGLFSLAAVSAMSIGDELRQAQSVVRTGSVWDVVLDVSGGVLAIAIGLALERRYRRSRESEVG